MIMVASILLEAELRKGISKKNSNQTGLRIGKFSNLHRKRGLN